MWPFTHRVDPSVFHFLAALWFIQSWGAEVTEWLHAFAKAPHSCASFSTSCMQSLLALFLFSYCSMCGWICVCMSQCVRYQRACAAGWHMTQNCGRACAALQQQSVQRAAELSCCRTASLEKAEECMKVLIFGSCACVCVCGCVNSVHTDSLQGCAELEGAHRAGGVLIKLEKDRLKKKIAPNTVTDNSTCISESRGFIHMHTHTAVPADCVRWTAGFLLAYGWDWSVL